MRARVDIAAWEGMVIYMLGLVIGCIVGYTVRRAIEKEVAHVAMEDAMELGC